jgi:hypothetical protein
MDNICCGAINIVLRKQQSRIFSLSNTRETGVQLTMGKNWCAQIDDNAIQSQALTAIECRCICWSQWYLPSLSSLNTPWSEWRLEIKVDSRQAEYRFISVQRIVQQFHLYHHR